MKYYRYQSNIPPLRDLLLNVLSSSSSPPGIFGDPYCFCYYYSFIPHRSSLKTILFVVIGMIGAGIRCFAIGPDTFWIVIVGQVPTKTLLLFYILFYILFSILHL